jgi:hypothetical protein
MSLAAAPSFEPPLAAPAPGHPVHRARRLNIDSGQEAVVYLHRQSEVCRSVRSAGWPAPGCLAVRAIFADGAYDAIRDAGAAAIVTCNTIAHPTNGIDGRGLLADAAARLLRAWHAPATMA